MLDELVAAAAPGLVRSQSPRYFGYVIGGSLPAALAADWLAAAGTRTPAATRLARRRRWSRRWPGGWLLDLLGLPADASFGLDTGCQMAHFTCLAAARHAVLARAGWDVEDGRPAGRAARCGLSSARSAT